MRITLSSKGQVVLPAELRRQDGLRAGDCFDVERLQSGEYRLKRVEKRPNRGLVEWLQACPHKGWFQRPDLGTTDELEGPL